MKMRRDSAFALTFFLIGLATMASGCSSAPPAIDAVHVAPGAYGAAFDAALEVASANRLPPVLRDRRTGVIEAGPTTAASIFEPWHDGGATLSERLERTIQHYRRRAWFEFVPAGAPALVEEDGILSGADIVGMEPADMDRTTWSGPLELRVRVYLEQSHRPGLRPDTWTRLLTTYTEIVTAGGETADQRQVWVDDAWLGRVDDDPQDRRRRQGPVRSAVWTPVVRDTAFERRLLGQVDRLMGEISE